MKKTLFIALFTLTVNAIAQIPVSGLVAYYPFSGNANDMSGHNYNGTVYGASLTMDRFSNPNSAYSFDGQNDYIDLSNHVNNLNFSSPATISLWVSTKYDSPQTTFSITDGSTGLYGSVIYLGNNTTSTLYNELIIVFQQSTLYDKYITGLETTNRNLLINTGWHNIVVTYDNITTKIYLDNSLVSSSCTWGVNNGQYGNLDIAVKAMLGARYINGIGGYLNGYLDDVRIYNQVLTPAQITSLYNETTTNIEQTSVNDLIHVYPNPSTGKININCNFNFQSIEIYNILGETICSYTPESFQNSYELDLSNSPKGLYFVKINDGINTISEKIVIH